MTRRRRGRSRISSSSSSDGHAYLGIAVAEPRYNVVDEHADVLALDAPARVAEVIQQRVADVELLLDIRR